MIRVKTILGKLFSLKSSDFQLFSSVTDSYEAYQAVCPHCGAQHNCIYHESYQRDLISVENGKRVEYQVEIPRVRCQSCGRTHAILSDILIPFASYTLRFILHLSQ